MAETVEETIEAIDAPPTSIQDLVRKTKITAKVKRVELYGAFVDIGVGVNAILHVSQITGGKRIKDVLKAGDEITIYVDKVDVDSKKIMVSMIEPLAVEWRDLAEGNTYTGKVVRHENFGAFIDIGAEKEGLVHISEISHDYIRHPNQAIAVGDEVEVKVLSYSRKKRRINLSIKALLAAPEKEVSDFIEEVFELDVEDEVEEDVPTAMEYAIRRAMGSDAPPLKARKKGKKGRRRRRRSQDDIMGRTLEYHR